MHTCMLVCISTKVKMASVTPLILIAKEKEKDTKGKDSVSSHAVW